MKLGFCSLSGFLTAALLTACATPSFQLVPGGHPDDSILYRPHTAFTSNGSTRIPIPEVALKTNDPVVVSVVLPGTGGRQVITFTLSMSLGKLYANIPQEAIEPLASLPHLTETIYSAVSKEGDKLVSMSVTRASTTLVLATSLADRLPRKLSTSWRDAYNYEPAIKALALVPGMRLRLEAMLPVTADGSTDSAMRSDGSITAPAYLQILPVWDNGRVSVTLSPTLEMLGVQSNPCVGGSCPNWSAASGVHNLLGETAKLRSWSLLYPDTLAKVEHSTTQVLQFVNESLLLVAGVPAALLVATTTSDEMSNFIEKAKARHDGRLATAAQRKTARDQLSSLADAWRTATMEVERTSANAKVTRGELQTIESREGNHTPEVAAALEALKKERFARDALRARNADYSIDCSLADVYASCFVLRYRVLPLPEILVTIQGVPRWVEIGTTVGMVLASHEPIRAASSFSKGYPSTGDEWLNQQSRLRIDKLDLYRLHMGTRFKVTMRPGAGNPDDAFRQINLQAGDEIKWSY